MIDMIDAADALFWFGLGALAVALGAIALMIAWLCRIPLERRCRICGCHEYAACVDAFGEACYWIENDLCSACHEALITGRWIATAPGPAKMLHFPGGRREGRGRAKR